MLFELGYGIVENEDGWQVDNLVIVCHIDTIPYSRKLYGVPKYNKK